MTDQEIIDKVYKRMWPHMFEIDGPNYFMRCVVRYTRWLERAKCEAEYTPFQHYCTD